MLQKLRGDRAIMTDRHERHAGGASAGEILVGVACEQYVDRRQAPAPHNLEKPCGLGFVRSQVVPADQRIEAILQRQGAEPGLGHAPLAAGPDAQRNPRRVQFPHQFPGAAE